MICKILLGVALASVASTAGAATAATEVSSATLSIGKGTVLVLSSDSSQYLTAKPGQVLKPGDRVMVMQGGSAAVKYTNGQTSALAPNTLADIGASSALTFGSRTSATQKKIGPMYAQAVGDDQNKKCRGSDGKEKACDTDNDGGPAHGPDPFVIAAGIGVGVAIVALESGSNSDRHHTLPISAP